MSLTFCSEVCKSVRNEGGPENNFDLQLIDFDGAKFAEFAQQYSRFNHLFKKANVTFRMMGRANWANLQAWIKAQHHGAKMQPSMEECISPDDFVVAGTFGLAELMKHQSWPMLEKALECMHKSLTVTPWGANMDWDELS